MARRALALAGACALAFGCGGDRRDPEIKTRSADGGEGGQPEPGGSGGGASGATGTGGAGSGGHAGSSSGASTNGGSGGTGGVATGGTGGVPPSGPAAPRFIGRFTYDGKFAWSGSAIELRFTGDEISVTLDDWGHNFFEIIVDGKHDVLEVDAGPNTYELASNLGPGEHEVLVYRRSEAFLGPSQFLGFSVPPSNWLPSKLAPERKVEIVADSTAVGYGIEGKNQYCGFSAKTENAYLAYGEITARALDAEVRTIGWSGIGVYRDNGGNTENTMDFRYRRTLPTDDKSGWDFSWWSPQVVVVNLGSNDFVANDPGPVFEAKYNELLDEIRGNYPGVRVYCAVGSSVYDSEYPRLKARLEAIVALRTDDVHLLDFGTTDYEDSYACDWHPSASTHQQMADVLTERLRDDLGW